jgi:hypothetical protein
MAGFCSGSRRWNGVAAGPADAGERRTHADQPPVLIVEEA